MNGYRIETHLHTTYCSRCGWLGAEPILTEYKKQDYRAICVTDHYNRTTFEYLEADLSRPGPDLVRAFELGYRRMSEAAEKYGILVFRGAELRFDGSDNDYLLYNYDPALLEDPEKVISSGLEAFRDELKKSNPDAVLIQAHPYRKACLPARADLLDGIEAFNASIRHNSRNELAKAYAEEHQLLQTSGSDSHRQEDLARSGILADWLPQNEAEFAKLLRSGDFHLIIPEEDTH